MIPHQIPGLTRRLLAHEFAQRGYRRGAEIGVRQGAFSLVLCKAMPALELLCVDPWQYYPTNPKQPSQDRQEQNFAIARARLAPYTVRFLRMFSLDAVQQVPLGSLDFVYLDGNHRYAYVRDDLDAWSQRVRAGGIVSGDDYDAPGVTQAVQEYVDAHGNPAVWLTDDPQRKNRKGERFTSWWWEWP